MKPWRLDRHGWLEPSQGVRHAPSPNVDKRPPGTTVSLLVLHNISLPPGEFGEPHIEALFTNRLRIDAHPWFARLGGLRVSAHFLLQRDGGVIQFASTEARAWHAGTSVFAGRPRCNDYSLGVELEGTDELPYTDAQYSVLARLTKVLRTRYPLAAVRGHEHIAPGRKTDPGPAFDWARHRHTSAWLRRHLPQLNGVSTGADLPRRQRL